MYKIKNFITHMASENLDYLKQNFKYVAYSEDTEIVFVPTGRFYGTEFLSQFLNLKIIASNTTGSSHIDTDYCKKHGIKVITLTKDPVLYKITAVAELTIGLIIALTRNIIPASKSVLDGKWNRYDFGGHKMLSKMSLGIIGMGRIGTEIFNRSMLFKENIGWDKNSDILEGFHNILYFCDVITIHIPLEGNKNLFDKFVFERMKTGSYFINTSRGEIVNENALLWALESGKLAGAATDVLSGEFEDNFDPNENKLVQYAREHDNLIITPHIGGSTEDAWAMTERRIIDKVLEEISA